MSTPRRRARQLLTHAVVACLVAGVLALVGAAPASAASTLVVNTTADTAARAGACGDTSVVTVPSTLSLREAVCLANNIKGSAAISVPQGTYTLANGELQLGRHAGQEVTLTGAGAARTIIDANRKSRVLTLDPDVVGGVAVTISDVTIAGGRDDELGGAGIIGGSDMQERPDVLTIRNSVVTGNTANTATPNRTNLPGGGVQFVGGSLTILDSTISDNSSGSSPGAGVAYRARGIASTEALTITGTTFSGNTTTSSSALGDANGGALETRGTSSSRMSVTDSRFVDNTLEATTADGAGAAIRHRGGRLTVTGSTFTGNQVSGRTDARGGAVEIESGTAALNFNRFVGNTAASGAAVHTAGAAGDVDAEHNWFGCNGAPGAAGCDTVSADGSSLDVTPRLVVTATASPSSVEGPNGTSTVEASLLTDSSGDAVAPSDLTAFAGLPVTWSAPLPSPATINGKTVDSTTDIVQGVARAVYDSQTSGGPGSVTTTFDNAALTPTITVLRELMIGTNPTDSTVDIGDTATFTVAASGFPDPTYQWQRSTGDGSAYSDITGANAATYSFTAAGRDNGTRYRAVVTSGEQSLTSTAATLTVVGPAQFTSPDTATFVRGAAGSFAVTTSGLPTVSSITRSGALPPGLAFADNGDGTATISGTPATGAAGRYRLELVAANGIDPSGTQTLTLVVDTAPEVTTEPTGKTVDPGTSVSFTAAASGYPAPSVQWQRSTDGGDSFVNLAGATSPTLTLTASADDDKNRYRAVFTNTRGAATSRVATLRVGTAPAFTSAARTTFAVGSKGTFVVETSGVPTASVSTTDELPAWLDLADNGDGTATLTGTPPVGSGDTYELTIRAANGFDPAAVQTFTLTVDELPAFSSSAKSTFDVGAAGTFTVTTTAGFPRATTLTQTGDLPDGVTFTDNGDGTATLAGTPMAGSGDAYPLTLTATNASGSKEQGFALTVRETAKITSVDKATFVEERSGSFTVTTTGGYPNPSNLSLVGALPSGLTFTDNGDGTATVAGTSAKGTAGTFDVVVKASNGSPDPAVQDLTLTVVSVPAFMSDDSTTLAIGKTASFDVTTQGSPRPALSLTGTLPDGVTFTDDGDGTGSFSGKPKSGTTGRYPLTFTATNVAGSTEQSFVLTVTKASQVITVTSVAPTDAVVKDSYTPAATSDSGLDVAVSIDRSTTGSACSIAAGVVTFDEAGTCVVAFVQDGDDTFAAAPKVTQSVAVTRTATTIGVTTSTSPSVFGQPTTATATVATARGAAVSGTVQFTVDGADLGAPVTVDDGSATSLALQAADGIRLGVGSHVIGARFTPADVVRFDGVAGTTTQVVSQAATTTTLDVGSTFLRATIVPVAPGSGTPTGTVTFSVAGGVVGSAPLVEGVATLKQTVPSGSSRAISAVYGGDTSFTASSTSTSRNDPTITAKVTSGHAKSRYGWFRGPVTITFTCRTNGAALSDPCPSPVRLARRGAGRSVTRTITSVDGGAATASVRGINIDNQRPTLKIRGVKKGGLYGAKAPKARCVAKDRVSGIASCKVSTRKRGTTTTVTATATDKAGNKRSTTLRYLTSVVTLEGARFRKGAYDVRRGRSYTLVVHSGSRPRYYQAEVAPLKPRKPGRLMRPAGRNRYALGVTMVDLRGRTYWNLGVKIGKTMHVVRVRARG